MKTEFLKEMGLSQEQIDKVMAENGKDIEKYKADGENLQSSLATLQSQLKERDDQLKELSKVDGEALQAKIKELEKQNKDQGDSFAKETTDIKRDTALKLALNGKVHNPNDILNSIDKEAVKIDDKGGLLTDIEELLKPLRESSPHYFVPVEASKAPQVAGATPIEGADGEGTAGSLLDEKLNSIFELK